MSLATAAQLSALPAPGEIVALEYKADVFDARIVLVDRANDLVAFEGVLLAEDDAAVAWVGDLEVARLSELRITTY
jgi:hypothetical protein